MIRSLCALLVLSALLQVAPARNLDVPAANLIKSTSRGIAFEGSTIKGGTQATGATRLGTNQKLTSGARSSDTDKIVNLAGE